MLKLIAADAVLIVVDKNVTINQSIAVWLGVPIGEAARESCRQWSRPPSNTLLLTVPVRRRRHGRSVDEAKF